MNRRIYEIRTTLNVFEDADGEERGRHLLSQYETWGWRTVKLPNGDILAVSPDGPLTGVLREVVTISATHRTAEELAEFFDRSFGVTRDLS